MSPSKSGVDRCALCSSHLCSPGNVSVALHSRETFCSFFGCVGIPSCRLVCLVSKFSMMSMGTRDAVVAVAAGLGRSSSRVADCNSLKPEASDNQNAREFDSATRGSSKQNIFSRLVAKSAAAAAAKTKKQKSPSSSNSWPRSPSHLVSRLLLSPDMNPMTPTAAGAAGDQSPARGGKNRFRRRHNNREFFSGPLLGGGRKQNGMFEAGCVAKDEPTSPKVTCMGTVKAPKKQQQHKEKSAARRNSSRPPKWRDSLKNFSGPLDLSRFGHNSGELAPPPASSSSKKHQQQKGNCVFGKSLLALQQQEEHKEWAAAVESRTTALKNLRIVVQKQDVDEEELGEFARWKKSLRIVVPGSTDSSNNCLEKNSAEQNEQLQQPAMRKAEEICIWKRRCIAEPMKLDIRRN